MPKPARRHVRADEGGARRLVDDQAAPAPTVMAGGIGSVNTGQYTVKVTTNSAGRERLQGADLPAPTITKSGGGAGGSGRGGELVKVPGSPTPPAAGKPPYRVPPMSELASVPKTGLRAISTFSGCGGSSLGYRLAGFDVLWASEFVPAARDCYRANFPTTILDERDIREVKPEDVLEAIRLESGELDLFDGSPPCASFSTAGKRSEGWGKVKRYSDVEQRTDDLFFEYVRLLKGIKPRCFVAENVSGLVKGVAKGYFLEILAALKGAGYRVACRVLDAQWLGVPQARQRTIFVGVREDLVNAAGRPIQPAHPSPLPYRYSVRDAIPWIAGPVDNSKPQPGSRGAEEPSMAVRAMRAAHFKAEGAGQELEMVTAGNLRHTLAGRPPTRPTTDVAPTITATPQDSLISPRLIQQQGAPGIGKKPLSIDRPLPTVCGTQSQQFKLDGAPEVEPESSMEGLATGAEWSNVPVGGQSERYFQLVKPALDGSCPTVTAAGGNPGLASVCHPTERRKFSIAELKRICAFPDDFILTGSYAQRWERLGRAVPPLMMRAIAEAVRDRVLLACPTVAAEAAARLAAKAVKAGPRPAKRR